MTICIAAICESCKAVIVASDRMLTAGFLALEFEHPDSKMEELSDSCVGLTAGDALAHTELFRACRQHVEQLKSPQVELIANEIKEQFIAMRQKRAEEEILKPRGFTLNQFYKEGFINRIPSDLAMMIDHSIKDRLYPLSILVAGVDDSGAHIYSIEDPGMVNCFDRLGYDAIGSGDRHALYSIVDKEHSADSKLNDTIFTVYEAKKRAELAPGVGGAVEMAIITRKSIRYLTKSEKSQLEKIFTQKIEPRQKEIEEAISGLTFEDKGKE
jgi:hypothetical protein